MLAIVLEMTLLYIFNTLAFSQPDHVIPEQQSVSFSLKCECVSGYHDILNINTTLGLRLHILSPLMI